MTSPPSVVKVRKRKRQDDPASSREKSRRLLCPVALPRILRSTTALKRKRDAENRPYQRSEKVTVPPLSPSSLRRLSSSCASTEDRVKAWLAENQTSGAQPSTEEFGNMSSSRARSKRSCKSKSGSAASEPSSATTRDSFGSIYDPQAMRVLIDNGIYDPCRSLAPANLPEIQARMARPRASLSPSRYDADTHFEQHRSAHYRARNEAEITAAFSSKFPSQNSTFATGRNTSFSAMADLTTPPLPKPKPDVFSGVDFQRIPQSLRNDIGPYIMSTLGTDPALVNSFEEYKGPDGKESNLLNQVIHNGAAGARAIQKTRSYRRDCPPDGNARTFVTTYQAGTVRFYTSHALPPTSSSPGTTYHTFLAGGEHTLGSAENLRRGITAYRNLQDLAGEERELAMQQAASAPRRKSAAVTTDNLPGPSLRSRARVQRREVPQVVSKKGRRRSTVRSSYCNAEANSEDEYDGEVNRT